MKKIPVNNIAAVSIISSAEDPSQIFLEIKTSDYPVKVFAGSLCLIGGNWVGEAAKADQNPLDTLRREINEELCLVPLSEKQAGEMELLGLGESTCRDLQKDTKADEADILSLSKLKINICQSLKLFAEARIFVPKSVFDSVDSGNKRVDTSVLSSYWVASLGKKDWDELVRLQQKYGNLSNESISVILTFEEIRRKGLKCSWGHDCALDLFCKMFIDKKGVPLVPGIEWELVDPHNSYDEYLEEYEVAKHP